MMFVWWAVFFFAGTFFSSGVSGASAAMAASSILAFFFGHKYPSFWQRAFLTCSSGLLVYISASLMPVDTDLLSGTRGPVRRQIGYSAPVSMVREKILLITGSGSLDDRTSGLLKALLIADRKSTPARARRDWSATGTAHYLALSGLHLGLIAVPLFGLLTIAGARGVVRDVAALFALSFYAAVAGTPGSLLRALSMMTVLRLSRLAGIRIDLARSVMAGAFLVCLLDRRSLDDTGFLLSFNAAAGVALLGIPVCGYIQNRMAGAWWKRILRFPTQSIAMSVSVQLSMLPFAVSVFGFVPVAGPLMSVLLVLPVTALLYGGFIYVIAGHLLDPAAALPLNLISRIAAGLVAFGAGMAWPGILGSDFDARIYVPALGLCALGLRWRKGGARLLVAGSVLLILSFLPRPMGRDRISEGPAAFPRHGAEFYFGTGGILVLEGWPQDWSVPYLVRGIRRAGVRGAACVVILDPGGFHSDGISILIRDLGIEHVLVSPWADGACRERPGWQIVRQDTVLIAGKTRLILRPPPVLPGTGTRASGEDASLVISPLD